MRRVKGRFGRSSSALPSRPIAVYTCARGIALLDIRVIDEATWAAIRVARSIGVGGIAIGGIRIVAAHSDVGSDTLRLIHPFVGSILLVVRYAQMTKVLSAVQVDKM